RTIFSRAARSLFYDSRNGGDTRRSVSVLRYRVALHAATGLSAGVAPASARAAAYTTAAHWWGERIAFGGVVISEEKRDSFLKYLDLPSRVPPALELALTLGDAAERERKFWGGHGWRIRDAHAGTASPEEYRAYIQQSR